MNDSNRLESIDIAKGIGIILVVFAHTLVPQIRDNHVFAKFIWIFIYNFHMPLFLFLSGWLFEKNINRYSDKGKSILKKLKLLIVPYVTFSVFAYVFVACAVRITAFANVLQSGGYDAVGIKDALFQIITYNGHIDQHLWFVFSLFIIFTVNILAPRIMKSKITLVILLILYVSKAYIGYFGILNYTAGDLFFFSLARIVFSGHKQEIKSNSLMNLILILIVFITSNIIYSYFYVTEIPSGITKSILYLIRCISSVTGIFTVCAVSVLLKGKRIAKPLKTAGLYSFDIYLMHAPFLVSGSMGILLAYTSLPYYICSVLVLSAGILLPYIFSRFFIRKIPVLSVLILGKNYKTDIKADKNSVSIT